MLQQQTKNLGQICTQLMFYQPSDQQLIFHYPSDHMLADPAYQQRNQERFQNAPADKELKLDTSKDIFFSLAVRSYISKQQMDTDQHRKNLEYSSIEKKISSQITLNKFLTYKKGRWNHIKMHVSFALNLQATNLLLQYTRTDW